MSRDMMHRQWECAFRKNGKLLVSLSVLALEFVYCGVWAALYFTAAIAVATKGRYEEPLAAAAFFGFVAMILYGADAFFKYKGWKSGEPAQGERSVPTAGLGASNTVSPTSPNYPAY